MPAARHSILITHGTRVGSGDQAHNFSGRGGGVKMLTIRELIARAALDLRLNFCRTTWHARFAPKNGRQAGTRDA